MNFFLRQLVIEYVRYRAAHGAKFHRIDWSSLPDLPAPPDACKRRMALLNSDLKFRKSVMRLCNMLSERYVKHLNELQNQSLKDGDCSVIVRDSLFGKECHVDSSCKSDHNEEGFEERWDDFDNKNVKIILDEVLQYKGIAKLDASKRVGSVAEKWADLNMNDGGCDYSGTERVPSFNSNEENHGNGNEVRPGRLNCHRLPKKYSKLWNEGISISSQAHESLAVSNAAELFKLVFLSTSTAPEVPKLLAETLRRYSEHDLFVAFNYLREKKIMVGGCGGNPFALSLQFLHSISSSPFPTNTGKRAAKFASWIHEQQNNLMEEGIDLPADLQCGDIFHLCALVFAEELLISPCLPDKGVGEAEDSRTLKRKSDCDELSSGDKTKRMKSSLAGEGEIISRREKGFPGIRLSICRAAISRIDAIELFKDGDIHNGTLIFGENDKVNESLGIDIGGTAFPHDHVEEIFDKGSIIPTAVAASESVWETMASYTKHLMSLPTKQQVCPFNSDIFRDVYLAIQKAGDQGLSMEEVSQVINAEGENITDIIVEVLKAFGRALKVNSYDSIHVVDSLYRSKYFLTSISNLNQYPEVGVATHSNIDDEHLNHQSASHEGDGPNASNDLSMQSDEVHKVTILNLPEEVYQPSSEMQSSKKIEGCKQAKLLSLGSDQVPETFEFHSGDFRLCRPILPWVNGDGTINPIVYQGLVRRVLGIVMQNPGILEDHIINQMNVLNPQSCRNLLRLMIMDNHIIVRKMHETTYGEPPAILSNLLGSRFKKSKSICQEHFFANPLCTTLL
ncbi:hypothetical protein U1Q18_006406 [Sarracenia purpurea var. burkii]